MPGAQNTKSVAERRAEKAAEAERKRRAAVGETDAPPTEALLTELVHNPRNPREMLDDLDGLAATYATVGVLQPVVVVPSATYADAFPEHQDDVAGGPWVVIGGNRRLAAARLAGIEKLPILVNTTATDRKGIVVASAVENLQREALKPLEELATIEELKEVLGTYDAVAVQLGKSAAWVSLRRRLHNLEPEVRTALSEGANGMTIEVARDLGKIKGREQQLAAWQAEQDAAAARAAEPKKTKAAKKASTADRPPSQRTSEAPDSEAGGAVIPPQAGPHSDPSAGTARRDACALAVATVTADTSALYLAALQAPAPVEDALELASRWLVQAAVGASALDLSALLSPEDNERQQRAALALALAHLELQTTARPDAESPQTRTYLDWLEGHTDYQPEQPAFTA
ncbi:ParB/RepB/Spo0J family partition protein [Streptomyces sp. H10-C2]|uniref:ParB/RepB/Spo0J family partition protein n=1 Tax=unclassified Streptomyces TaxID=2593676 RepID=UPI0024B97421|nr:MULTISPECIES: ParB/RepB/Spo0J family partition protein [unclassified Streptomyces]MDJ0345889.1 ParB/RepB/Spo0J family partition protein [Streptomyces sp. PH10-H1]MDJ0374738.1 ParB/RepB/Spo0J family partition protein [Streptomyces sp. H10-C2]